VLFINKRHLPSTTLVSACWWPERPRGGSPSRPWTRSPHQQRQQMVNYSPRSNYGCAKRSL